mmetsp:Transcript_23247/g.48252  ORF Transcript_23247/g.48252 Transcript_23247/m.48252 type:complete len:211 (+) Transcript_23247:574-1206(+)
MERAQAPVSEGADAVLEALGDVLANSGFLEPVGLLLGLAELEQVRAQDEGGVDCTIGGLDEVRLRVETFQDGAQPSLAGVVHEVHLVHHDNIGEFELVAEQLSDGSLVFRRHLPAAVPKHVGRVEFIEERASVHDRNESVQACDVAQTSAGVVREGERLRDRHGLGYAGGLDQNVVWGVLYRGEGRELHEQIFTQSAANAAVRELNHLLL